MQPGVTPGAVLELHAARALNGTSPGVNSPLTTTFFDTSGNGNHGTLQTFAGTEASGWAGTGTVADPYRLVFDGAAPYEYVLGPDIDPQTDPFSVDGWFMVAGVGSGFPYLISNFNGSDAGFILLFSGGQVRFYVVSPGHAVALAKAFALVGSGMTYICAVWTGSKRRLYVNDAAAVEDDWTFAGAASAQPVRAGLRYDGLGYYPGATAVARIYPFALTPAQVAANYAAGYLWPGFIPGVMSHHFIPPLIGG